MNKFEFLTKTDIELEQFEKEEKELNSKMEFYNAVAPSSYRNEIEEIKNRLNEISALKKKFADFVGFSAYARIMTMSSAEIEEYKKEKIGEIDSEIAILNEKLKNNINKKEELEKKEQKLLTEFTSSTDEYEKERIIEEAREVKQDIYSLEKESRENIADLQKKIGILNNNKNDIMNKTDDQIKVSIAREIENFNKCREMYEKQRYDGPDEIDEILVYLVDTNKIGNPSLYKVERNLSEWVLSDSTLDEAEEKANSFYTKTMFAEIPCSKSYGLRNNINIPYETAFDFLDQIEEDFKKVSTPGVSPFLDHSSMYQMSRLYKAYHSDDEFSDEIFIDEVQKNIQLFDKYFKHIDTGYELTLSSYYDEYKKYEGKHFLSRKQKERKEELERSIIDKSKELYRKLEESFREMYDMFLYTTDYKTFPEGYMIAKSVSLDNKFDYYMETQEVDELVRIVEYVKKEIAEARKELESKQEYFKKEVEEIKQRKATAEQNIKDAVPEDYKDISIRSIINRISNDAASKYSFDGRIEKAAVKSREKIKDANLVDVYIEKAQNESDIREAEIKDITLEELLAQKRAALMEKKNIQKDDNAPFERIEDDPSVTPRTIS